MWILINHICFRVFIENCNFAENFTLMDAIIPFLIEYGSLGMFIAGFLSGSILPFSSEVVLVALLAGGANVWGLLIWGTIGNSLGSYLNYLIGTLGKEEWITKYAGVSPEKLQRGMKYVRRYGAWAGLLSWVPVIGELITVAMGYLRTKQWASILMIVVGKFLRYLVLAFALKAL